MNQYFKNNINAVFSDSKESEPIPKLTARKASGINVTEVLKPNTAFHIVETHKKDIKKASLPFFLKMVAIGIIIRNTYQA